MGHRSVRLLRPRTWTFAGTSTSSITAPPALSRHPCVRQHGRRACCLPCQTGCLGLRPQGQPHPPGACDQTRTPGGRGASRAHRARRLLCGSRSRIVVARQCHSRIGCSSSTRREPSLRRTKQLRRQAWEDTAAAHRRTDSITSSLLTWPKPGRSISRRASGPASLFDFEDVRFGRIHRQLCAPHQG